ncbi:MAG TPA: serine O-acetyltransferase EpsC [Anaeromyxobacteraceae bacterium]|nr:serine O-acetyltransferase EpsC [Anaeromyxobacteraceae bacterium]
MQKVRDATSSLKPTFSRVLDELASAGVQASGPRWNGKAALPSRDAVIESVERIRRVFFPGYFGDADLHDDALHFYVGATLADALRALEEQIRRAIAYVERHDLATCDHCREAAERSARAFLERLPEVRRLLASDIEAAFEGDPALKIKEEAIFSYPGIFALTEQRLSHELYVLGVPLIPRIISEHAHSETGIDIHPGATIGEGFFIDHGTGVVIGETSRIGKRVRIYQGVTLGAKSFPLDEKGIPIKGIDRHPVVEDDVVIYAGATILGRVTIGQGSSIGGNVWLTHGVPPRSRVTQAEVRETRFEHGGGI